MHFFDRLCPIIAAVNGIQKLSYFIVIITKRLEFSWGKEIRLSFKESRNNEFYLFPFQVTLPTTWTL